MTELKPCPFCGGNAKLARDVTCGYETFWAFCTDCHAQANYGHSEAEAARTWNVRADDQSQAAAYWRRLYEETVAERTCTMLRLTDYTCQYMHRYMCSECGEQVEQPTVMGKSEPPNYCPNCGAKVVDE